MLGTNLRLLIRTTRESTAVTPQSHTGSKNRNRSKSLIWTPKFLRVQIKIMNSKIHIANLNLTKNYQIKIPLKKEISKWTFHLRPKDSRIKATILTRQLKVQGLFIPNRTHTPMDQDVMSKLIQIQFTIRLGVWKTNCSTNINS